jgi:uncharacterized membrane protein
VKVLESAKPRLFIALLLGAAASAVGSRTGAASGVLIGVATAGVVLVGLGWLVLWPMDSVATRAHVGTEDVSPPVGDVLIVGIPMAGLVAIAALLVGGGEKAGSWAAAVAVLGVFMSWAALHLMFATRYAHLYFTGEAAGGIDFDEGKGGYVPRFSDFLYFSYNLGMTYQVSDTGVTDPTIRRFVLGHCLLSYVFGTAILATTINLVVGALTT